MFWLLRVNQNCPLFISVPPPQQIFIVFLFYLMCMNYVFFNYHTINCNFAFTMILSPIVFFSLSLVSSSISQFPFSVSFFLLRSFHEHPLDFFFSNFLFSHFPSSLPFPQIFQRNMGTNIDTDLRIRNYFDCFICNVLTLYDNLKAAGFIMLMNHKPISVEWHHQLWNRIFPLEGYFWIRKAMSLPRLYITFFVQPMSFVVVIHKQIIDLFWEKKYLLPYMSIYIFMFVFYIFFRILPIYNT